MISNLKCSVKLGQCVQDKGLCLGQPEHVLALTEPYGWPKIKRINFVENQVWFPVSEALSGRFELPERDGFALLKYLGVGSCH